MALCLLAVLVVSADALPKVYSSGNWLDGCLSCHLLDGSYYASITFISFSVFSVARVQEIEEFKRNDIEN